MHPTIKKFDGGYAPIPPKGKEKRKKLKSPGEPKTDEVFAAIRCEPEAGGRTYIPWNIDPRATAQHTERAFAVIGRSA